MYRRADEAGGFCDFLALEHTLAWRDTGFGRGTQVLSKRHHQAAGQWRLLDGRAIGQRLALRWVNATVDIPDVQGSHAACSRSLAIS